MGCHGSRGGRSARRVGGYLAIDLADFCRDWFEPGRVGELAWKMGQSRKASVGYMLGADYIELRYTVRRRTNEECVRERINLSYTNQTFGGRRMWFLCNGCGARCRVLLGGRYFRCRKCHGATYTSQYDPCRFPELLKAEAARKKVGAEQGFANVWPRKPKGMHWRTYRRLEALNRDANVAWDRLADRYLRR